MDRSTKSLPLGEYLECYQSPSKGIIASGDKDILHEYGDDLLPGTELIFHKNVKYTLNIALYDNGQMVSVGEIPVEFKGRFKLLPFDPESGDISVEHIFETVGDLCKAFPTYVEPTTSWNNVEMPEWSLEPGMQLKLLRITVKDNEKVLECRKMGQTRVMCLPMLCMADFKVLNDNNDYTVTELCALLPRCRRISYTSQSNKDLEKFGLPTGYEGDIFIEKPEGFVEVSPAVNPDVIIGLPSNLTMSVMPHNDQNPLVLNALAQVHKAQLPVIARVAGWEEESNILENHSIKPGVDLIIHGWTRQAKVLAQTYAYPFCIPLTYGGQFSLKPKTFKGVAQLDRAHPDYMLKVLLNPDPSVPLAIGDLVKVKREDTIKKKKGNQDINNYMFCVKYNHQHKPATLVRLPLSSNVEFEEVNDKTLYHIRDLVQFVQDHELDVELQVPSPDQKFRDKDLPRHTTITLTDNITESAVYCSVEVADAPAFHIPLRTLLYLTVIGRIQKEESPLLMKRQPRLSTMDRCAEMLPPPVFNALQTKVRVSGNVSPGSVMSIPLSAGYDHPNIQGSTANRIVATPASAYNYETTTWNAPASLTGKRVAEYHTDPVPNVEATILKANTSTIEAEVIGTERKQVWPSTQHSVMTTHTSTNVKTTSSERDSDWADIPHTSTTQSVSGYESYKKKSLKNIFRNKFRRKYKSTENIFKASGSAKEQPQLTVPEQPPPNVDLYTKKAETTSYPDFQTVQTRVAHSYSNQYQDESTPFLSDDKVEVEAEASTSNIEPEPQASPTLQVNRKNIGQVPEYQQNGSYSPPQSRVSHDIPSLKKAGATTSVVTKETTIEQHLPNGTGSTEGTGATNYNPLMVQPMMIPQPIPQTYPQVIPQIPAGYQMVQVVPVQQPGQTNQTYMMMVPGIMPGTTGQNPPGVKKQEDGDDDSDSPQIPLSKTKHFDTVIPPDGNLYGFTVKEMATFFSNVGINDVHVEGCIKHKIDGKKFSRLREAEMDQYGLLHPVIMHFRRHSAKPNSSASPPSVMKTYK